MGGKPGKQERDPAVILESLFTSTIGGELIVPVLIYWHFLVIRRGLTDLLQLRSTKMNT